MALSHCLECSEWIDSPCSYVRCPFRVAAPIQSGFDASEGQPNAGPAVCVSLHSATTTPGGAPE
jgi:hypothetical protein